MPHSLLHCQKGAVQRLTSRGSPASSGSCPVASLTVASCCLTRTSSTALALALQSSNWDLVIKAADMFAAKQYPKLGLQLPLLVSVRQLPPNCTRTVQTLLGNSCQLQQAAIGRRGGKSALLCARGMAEGPRSAWGCCAVWTPDSCQSCAAFQ